MKLKDCPTPLVKAAEFSAARFDNRVGKYGPEKMMVTADFARDLERKLAYARGYIHSLTERSPSTLERKQAKHALEETK